MYSTERSLNILGIRGIPAQHGGFETFAEKLSVYLAEKDWSVRVYCQEYGRGDIYESSWNGIQRVQVPIRFSGSRGSILFDLISALDASKRGGLNLTLGYNTALFSLVHRFRKRRNIMNMDGIEWQREKWSYPIRSWFFINEVLGCRLANHLVADHPSIKAHLIGKAAPEKITTIGYGGDEITDASEERIAGLGVLPYQYALVIARPEPENSILEIVRAFSSVPRGIKLVILGKFDPDANPYHTEIVKSASDEVLLPGAIYEKPVVDALRYFCRFYIHGHTAGGTNPSLVEAMGAGAAVIAQDNPFNRWVAGDGASYFDTEEDCVMAIDRLLRNEQDLASMRKFSSHRFQNEYTWQRILSQYEGLLTDWLER